MTTKRAHYTLQFKQEAVRLVEGGQSIARAARSLRVVDETLFNWVNAHRAGELTVVDSKLMSAEQMEISRLRAELTRVNGVRRTQLPTQGGRRAHDDKHVKRMIILPCCLEEFGWAKVGEFELTIGAACRALMSSNR